jgi:hypothetical protein
MDRPRRAPMTVEALEDRAVPTVDVFYSGSSLLLRGAPNAISTSVPNTFSITRVTAGSPSQFRIMDGPTNLGTYQIVGNLNIQFTRRLVAVQLDLNQGLIPGNVLINQGTGYHGPFDNFLNPGANDIAITDKSAAPSGLIGGSVQILGGSGQEITNVGGFFDNKGILQQGAITIGGNFTDNAKQSAVGTGDQLQVTAGTRIGGNVTTSNVDGVVLGQQNIVIGGATQVMTIGNNVNISANGVSTGINANIFGTVGGSVAVNSSAGTSGFNAFTMLPVATGGGGSTPANSFIGGNLTVAYGPAVGGNLFTIQGGAGATSSIVGGNVTWIDNSNAGPDSFALGRGAAGGTATINGSLNVVMGNGSNAVTFDGGGTVNKNLNFTGGNGTNDLGGGGLGGVFSGNVFGSTAINLGNGTNNFTPSGSLAGQLIYTGGNGSNTVDFQGAAGVSPTVVLNFGSGTNSVQLDTPNIATLTVNGTGSGPNNTFNDAPIAPITFPTTLNNFV